jgi:hypothetical protein
MFGLAEIIDRDSGISSRFHNRGRDKKFNLRTINNSWSQNLALGNRGFCRDVADIYATSYQTFMAQVQSRAICQALRLREAIRAWQSLPTGCGLATIC